VVAEWKERRKEEGKKERKKERKFVDINSIFSCSQNTQFMFQKFFFRPENCAICELMWGKCGGARVAHALCMLDN
jgi:hypothetical protein